MKAKSTHSSPATPLLLQRLFLFAAAAAVVAQAIQIFTMIAQQWPHNHNLSAFAWWVISQAFVLGTWLILWVTRRNRDASLKTLFDTTLFTACILMLALAIGMLTWILPMPWIAPEGSLFFTTALPFAVTIPLTVIIIMRLRAAHQW